MSVSVAGTGQSSSIGSSLRAVRGSSCETGVPAPGGHLRRNHPATQMVRQQPREGPSEREIGRSRSGPYNHRQCQSLFGYAKNVHERSGCICQLCDCGSGEEISFELWRQMTVEHLIGRFQGGYLDRIGEAITERFPALPPMSKRESQRTLTR